ncbi:MAG: DNA polymerase III subunit beta [Planctomycetes bacterium]|nr:DNA polymerase III subunit beta [Planctomycetota bacterium]
MKILCDRQQLQDAFSVVGGIPPVKTPNPIVQNVLLRAEGDQVVFFATDYELSARSVMASVQVLEPGAVLLPARETGQLLRELSEPTVSLAGSDDHRTTIECGSGSYQLVGDDPAEFPAEPQFDGTVELQVTSGAFLEMFRRTSFAVAREETRYAINGLLLDYDSGNLRLVGTDGRRLALCHQEIEGPDEPARAVVPLRALQALGRAIDGEQDAVLRVQLGDNRIAFQLGTTTVISQLLDNRFPAYEQVIPKVAETSIEVDRLQLERGVRRVAVLSSGDVRMVRFEFRDAALLLSAESSGVGRAKHTIDATIEGPSSAISFNPDYLLDALKVSDREIIRIDMTDDSTPARFALGETYTYVLMPISGS